MNWRRGLFRLWVVFAFLWIGVTGWYEYVNKPWNENWPTDFNTEGRCWDALAKWPDGQRMTDWDALFAEMDVPENVEINKRNHAWAADAIPERNKWAETVRRKLKECEAGEQPLIYRASLMTRRIWSSLEDSLPIILLPPLLLLVAGYVAIWIVRGFRAKV
jgi:hypothetical protein